MTEIDTQLAEIPPGVEAPPAYFERLQRFNDALALRQPDRVPIASLAGFFIPRYAGLTHAEAMYDYDRLVEAWIEATDKLNWDMAAPPFQIFPGPVMDLLGLKTFKWPGRHFKEMLSYQFVEAEYMEEDEYDAFLNDPGDFVVRKMWPRMAETLEPFGNLPPLHWMSSGYTMLIHFAGAVADPAMGEALQKIIEIGEETRRYLEAQGRLAAGLAEKGYPLITTSFTEAPFDWISDMFRGMRGSMLDMYRQPDKLKAAIELVTPFMIQCAVGLARQTGNPRIFIPLHRGAGGFMSNEQFEEFYWPGLKQLIMALIDEGLTPMPFLEGDYTPRLKYLAELPPGKVLGHFDVVDLEKAKETIGDVMCFWGNVPAQMLATGTPEQVTDYVRRLIDIFGDNGGLIVDGAVEGVPPESRPENVEAMTEAVFKYGVYG